MKMHEFLYKDNGLRWIDTTKWNKDITVRLRGWVNGGTIKPTGRTKEMDVPIHNSPSKDISPQ